MAKYILKQAAIFALTNEANTHSNPIKRAYTRAAAIIEQITAEDVQPVNQWISVKDRLPDEGASVLICTNEGIRSVSARYGNRFFITIVEAFTVDTVTHWMPLPEPPKDGDTE